MAIQAQNQIGFPSEFSLINNNGGYGIGLGIDQTYINNNLQSSSSQKDFNQQALFHHQQFRSQNFLAAQMDKQKQEIDQFIKNQSERLRYMLQEQRKQETEMILRKMERQAMVLMSQKEEEMAKAITKNMELEDLLRKMETENQTWQRIARENESMVATLHSTLEQVKEKAAATCRDVATAEDEGSFCGGGGGDNSFPAEKMKISDCCVNCGSNGVTRVLFLPCRHLCCCTNCEDGLVRCPICNTPKKNRIEAFLS